MNFYSDISLLAVCRWMERETNKARATAIGNPAERTNPCGNRWIPTKSLSLNIRMKFLCLTMRPIYSDA